MARAKACPSVVLPTPGTPSISRWPRAKMLTRARRTTSSLPRITRRSAFSSSAAFWETAITVSGDIVGILLSAVGTWPSYVRHRAASNASFEQLPGNCPVSTACETLRLTTLRTFALHKPAPDHVAPNSARGGSLITRGSSLIAHCPKLLLRKLRRPSRQPLDALCDRGMGREQAAKAHSAQERLDDEQMRG